MLLPKIKKELPPAPPLNKIFGPSFILLGLGLGSGELILWPYLASQYGLGIIWGAVIGLTLQFFLNMEIERYTLATGESIFVGLARKFGRFSPVWFIFSTFVPWIWPGIVLTSATIFSTILNFNDSRLFAMSLLILSGTILTLGRWVYKTQEIIQKTLIFVSIPLITFLTFYLTNSSHWTALAKGTVGIGDNFFLLPVGIPLFTFLGALAYSGAGGNLNLAQSFYIKEREFGMGKHAGKITSLLYKEADQTTLEGFSFETNDSNLSIFKKWWRLVNIEHGVIFWATGLFTILLLAVLSFATTYGNVTTPNIGFLFKEAQTIGFLTLPFVGTLFLLITALTLSSTQFSVLDATSRIMAENLSIFNKSRFPANRLSHYFYFFLWLQILFQILILLMVPGEPLKLVVIGAVLNAITMFVYSGLIMVVNNTELEKPLRPSLQRKTVMALAFLFFGGFSLITLYQFLSGLRP